MLLVVILFVMPFLPVYHCEAMVTSLLSFLQFQSIEVLLRVLFGKLNDPHQAVTHIWDCFNTNIKTYGHQYRCKIYHGASNTMAEEKTLLIVALLLITLDSAQQLNEYHFWRGIGDIQWIFGKSGKNRSAMLCVKKRKEEW